MPGRYMLCPCTVCHNKSVSRTTWRLHTHEIANGSRLRHGAAPAKNPDPDPVLPVAETPAVLYAMEVAEQVATKRVTASGADAMLKITSKRWAEHIHEEEDPPPGTWYLCKEQAMQGRKLKSFARHFCPNCDNLFAFSLGVRVCPKCGPEKGLRFQAEQGKKKHTPRRVAHYYDLDDHMRLLFSCKFIAEYLAMGKSRVRPAGINQRELSGPFDGSILQKLYHNSEDTQGKDYYIFLAQSNDGVEVEKNVTYTPVVVKVLNASSEMYSTHTNKLMVGTFPKKVKDYQAMFRPIVRMYAKHAPGKSPLTVWNAYSGSEIQVWYVLAWTVNDIRALPLTTCGRHPPCYIGGCNYCIVGGQRHHGRTVYPGAVRGLPMNHPLRIEYAKIFEDIPAIARLAQKPKPHARTTARAKAAGVCTYMCVCVFTCVNVCVCIYLYVYLYTYMYTHICVAKRVLNGRSPANQEAFWDIDVLTEFLPYWDKIKQSLYGLEHEVANVIKQMLTTIKNHNGEKLVFGKKQREYEMETVGRFIDCLKPTRDRKFPRPPWVVEADEQKAVHKLPSVCKCPAEWPAFRKVFADMGFMKTAETMLLAGDVGVYVLRFCTSLRQDYRSMFIRLLRDIEKVISKVSTPGDRADAAADIPVVATMCEQKLPLYWNTMVMHIFIDHCILILELAGGFFAANILDTERWHTIFKTFGRSRSNIMASFQKNYVLWVASQVGRLSSVSAWTNKPAWSSAAGRAAMLDSENKFDRMYEPLGANTVRELTEEELHQIEEMWCVRDKSYDRFHDKCKRVQASIRRQGGRRRQAALTDIRQWAPRGGLTVQERKWQTMSNTVKVLIVIVFINKTIHLRIVNYAILNRFMNACDMRGTSFVPVVPKKISRPITAVFEKITTSMRGGMRRC